MSVFVLTDGWTKGYMDAVVKEFSQGLDRGHKNFELIDPDIGDYGKELGQHDRFNSGR